MNGYRPGREARAMVQENVRKAAGVAVERLDQASETGRKSACATSRRASASSSVATIVGGRRPWAV